MNLSDLVAHHRTRQFLYEVDHPHTDLKNPNPKYRFKGVHLRKQIVLSCVSKLSNSLKEGGSDRFSCSNVIESTNVMRGKIFGSHYSSNLQAELDHGEVILEERAKEKCKTRLQASDLESAIFLPTQSRLYSSDLFSFTA